jgi:hypothetical protein
MTVSRRVAQLGLGAAVLILLASMAIVFVGSTQGKQHTPENEAQPAKYVQHGS